MAAHNCALGVGLLCLLVMSVSAQQPSPGSPDGYEGQAEVVPPRNVTCKNTEVKRPGCTSTCPARCPQQCIVLCPNCKTFCHDEVKPAKPVPPPAMFVFGDGALDVGNNGYMPVVETEEGFSPQISQSSSGRFSNGANLADTIATSIGFQQSPPAYLSLRGGINMWGANYASAGAGIRNSTNGERCIPLWHQLAYFRATRAQMAAKLGNDVKLREVLSKSVFLVSVGSQDLDPTWNYEFVFSSPQTELQDLVALYGEAVTSLYDMGARKLAIVNVGLIGCIPPPRDYNVACDQTLNDRAIAFNAALKILMAGIASKKPDFSYSIGNYHDFTAAAFANPADYGMVNMGSCTHRGYLNQEWMCDNPDEYWLWDPEFMTDKASKLTAAAFYYGPPQYTMPMTFKALLEKK